MCVAWDGLACLREGREGGVVLVTQPTHRPRNPKKHDQADVLASSAYAMVAFMDNHCMLQLFNRPQWKTVKGRSTCVRPPLT